MGVSYSTRLIVGEIFKNYNEIEQYILDNVKTPLSEEDNELLSDDVKSFLDEKEDFPETESLDLYSDDEYYFGYSVFSSNPEDLIENVQRAVNAWKNVFKTNPKLYNCVRYS
jgi:hypothetical protein